ncbi:Aerotolerance protein BatD [hydrothermal vent metagenome]|uniref:Aerotolerance protein BatD n=1 Tax=hydrothermal vent metagenome TaxID=652676 RepID=A0A3B1BLF9_9ZZZZ
MKRIFILFCFLFIHLAAQATTITAQLDRNPVQINESFTLTFAANGSVDDDPDFKPLERDFEILSRNSGSNISIINGSYNRTKQWALVMMAKREGELIIPTIAFGSDQSPALRIRIKATDHTATPTDSNIFIELIADAEKSPVQAQIIITVRLLSAVNISQFAMSQLKISDLDTVVEPLGEDTQYQTSRAGRAYLVIERKYALFPQQAGTLHIPAQIGEVQIAGNRRNSFFDRFSAQGQSKRLRSAALEINVEPIPDSFKGHTWLPASKLQLTEDWSPSPPVFKVGEPVTRSISLIAEGATAAQLPELQKYSLSGIKLYQDQAELNDNNQATGIIGQRTEKVALVPTKPGNFTLPEIKIPWWNSKTKTREYARIPSRTINVLASTINSNQPTNSTPTEPAIPISASAANDIINEAKSAPSYWIWISLALASGWLLTLLFWFVSHRKKTQKLTEAQKKHEVSNKKRYENVIKACKKNDPHNCKNALIEWGRKQFPDTGINSLGDIVTQSRGSLKDEILKLNRAIYSRTDKQWNAQPLLNAFKTWEKNSTDETDQPQSKLQPLYPVH